MTRYFIRTSEAISRVLQAATLGDVGRVFMLDMGEPVKIVELARDLVRLSHHGDEEIPILFTGLRPGEKLFEERADLFVLPSNGEGLSMAMLEALAHGTCDDALALERREQFVHPFPRLQSAKVEDDQRIGRNSPTPATRPAAPGSVVGAVTPFGTMKHGVDGASARKASRSASVKAQAVDVGGGGGDRHCVSLARQRLGGRSGGDDRPAHAVRRLVRRSDVRLAFRQGRGTTPPHARAPAAG